MPRLIRRAAGRRRRRSSLLRPNSGVRTDRRGQCAREFSSLVDRRRCALAIADNADLLCLQQKRLGNALSERASVSKVGVEYGTGAAQASLMRKLEPRATAPCPAPRLPPTLPQLP